MSEFPFQLPLLIAFKRTNVVGALSYHDDLSASEEQLALGPGDPALAVGLHSELEGDMVAVRVLDPGVFASTFPDYQERLQRGYALCLWSSSEDPLGDIGWFSRVRLIPVDEEKHATVSDWFENDTIPDDPPKWLQEIFNGYTGDIAVQAPDMVPRQLPCGECGEYKVTLYVGHTTMYRTPAGAIQQDNIPKIAAMMSDLSYKCETTAILYCEGCEAQVSVDTGDIRFPEEHPVASHIQSHHHNH